ncbi:MAG TPA: nitroreductase family protein [Candidatus Lokiarchaeia archaeon]|nr:nitroreductase family protein [Candidatus Lokiarchaeia archaeon]
MDFYEVIKNRYSVRSYKPDPVPIDAVMRILEAARMAPTWANKQGVRYVVITDEEQVKNVADGLGKKWLKTVPMFIAAISNEKWSGMRSNLPYFMLDVGICFEHVILAATNEGLGTCWIGAFDEDKLKKVLKVQKNDRIIALTPLGYPDCEPGERIRKELSEIVYLNEFGKKME